MEIHGVINSNNDIKFIKLSVQLQKLYKITAAAIKNQIKAWNSELFLPDFSTLFPT